MKLKHVVAVIAFALTTHAGAKDTTSVSARGKVIKVGDTADSVFAVLKKEDMLEQDVGKDPSKPGSLLLTKRYNVGTNDFTLTFARTTEPGPYVVTRIDANEPPGRPGATPVKTDSLLPTTKALEASEFFKQYHPKKDSWPLKDGSTNNSYEFPDPENTTTTRSVSITEGPPGPKDISVLWYGLSNSKPAVMSKVKEDFVRDLLRSSSPGVNADEVVKYMKRVGKNKYPDGATVMPRAPINGIKMASGTAGSAFMIILEKYKYANYQYTILRFSAHHICKLKCLHERRTSQTTSTWV